MRPRTEGGGTEWRQGSESLRRLHLHPLSNCTREREGGRSTHLRHEEGVAVRVEGGGAARAASAARAPDAVHVVLELPR